MKDLKNGVKKYKEIMNMENPNIFEETFDELSVNKKDLSDEFDGKFNPFLSMFNSNNTPDSSEYRKRWNFPNGYGISVIRGYGTYGCEDGLFEIAVLKDNSLCYDTNITDDVIGNQTSKQVLKIGKQIAKL